MKDQSTFKKEKLKDEHFDVARTRKCAECGSDEEMRRLGRGNEVACTPPLRQVNHNKNFYFHFSPNHLFFIQHPVIKEQISSKNLNFYYPWLKFIRFKYWKVINKLIKLLTLILPKFSTWQNLFETKIISKIFTSW